MKQLKLALLLAIVFSAGSLLGYFNVSFNDTVLPPATYNHILTQDPNYPYIPAVENQWVCQLYATGADNQIDVMGLDGIPTDDDFLILPSDHQNATFGLKFATTGRWQPSGIRFYSQVEFDGGFGTVAPGERVYLRIFNSPAIATATRFTQFLIPYVVPSTGATVPVISGGYGWSPWADVPKPITDTWVYNLQFTVPAEALPGTTINGVGAPWLFIDPAGEPNTLIGDYTISAAPAGFHWENATFTLGAGDFVLAGKANYIYNAAKTFVLVEDGPQPIIVPPVPDGETLVGDGTNGLDVGVTVVAAANIPPELLGGDTMLPQQIYTIIATGIRDVIVPKPVGYVGVPWWCWMAQGGVVTAAVGNPLAGDVMSYTFVAVNFDAKGEVEIFINDEPTLPVELSSFAATLTAQNFVKLTWVSETETNLSGYRVYRSESSVEASAEAISGLIDASNTSSTKTYNHIDNEVSAATTYYYWLEVVEMDGTSKLHGPTNVYVETPESIVPSLVTNMYNAYPNPFKTNSSTSIAYEVKAGETGTITIYNIVGQVVKTVPVTETTSPKTFTWNGRDSKGNACGSGIYFYKLSTPSKNVTKKMVIVN
jgi:hypothetical protein